jgi:hypothetical protein
MAIAIIDERSAGRCAVSWSVASADGNGFQNEFGKKCGGNLREGKQYGGWQRRVGAMMQGDHADSAVVMINPVVVVMKTFHEGR